MIRKCIPLLAVLMYWYAPDPKVIHTIKGTLRADFEEIRPIFRKILDEESQGVSLTVLHEGHVVANLYGGYADKSSDMFWEDRTMTVAYSATKIFAGLVCGVLVSRGELDYDKSVAEYWPEFGTNGKENITVRTLLDHKAGLVTFHKEFTLQEALVPEIVSKIIEQSEPLWPPGSLMGYHALTYGFLIDQLVRRADSKKRSIQQFYVEEIQNHSEGDFYLGLPKAESYRLARIYNPTLLESIIAHAKHPLRFAQILSTFIKHDGMADKSANFPKFLSVMTPDSIPYNNIEVQQLPLISSLGIGTTNGFAFAVRQFWKAGLIKQDVWDKVVQPTGNIFEICIAVEKSYGHGFFYSPIPSKKNEWSVMFTGNGQQFVEFSKKDDLVIVLLRNGLKAGENGVDDYQKLRQTVYSIVNS